MKLRPDQLKAHLQKDLRPLYFISGDEPLQVNESTDALRAAARAQGYIEREVLEADTHFDWQQLLDAGNSMSLFADKRILDLRLPSGKPGKQGSDVLQAYAARPADDAVLIISAGKLESAAKNSKWFKSLDEAGVVIQCWPVNVAELPRWIEEPQRTRADLRLRAQPRRKQPRAQRPELERGCASYDAGPLDRRAPRPGRAHAVELERDSGGCEEARADRAAARAPAPARSRSQGPPPPAQIRAAIPTSTRIP